MPSFSPPGPSKKLRFTHLPLYKVIIIIIIIIINENLNVITHKYLQVREVKSKFFLPGIFWSFETKFRSSVDLCNFSHNHIVKVWALLAHCN